MDNNMNQNFNGQQNTGPTNFKDQQYGGPSNFTQQGYNNAQNINNNQAQQNNNGPKKSSELGKWAFLFSILGCTSFIGLILAIIDITRKDGKRKDFSIAALCVCGIIFFVFAFGKIKNSRSDHAEEKVRSEHVNKVEETETTTEQEVEEDISEINDENYISYKRESVEKNGFNESTNKNETIDSYSVKIPTYFGKQFVNKKGDISYFPLEEDNEFALLSFTVTDLGKNSYESREEDIKGFMNELGVTDYTTNDVVFSNMNSVEVSGRTKDEEDSDISLEDRQAIKAGIYYTDIYKAFIYDEENGKLIYVSFMETLKTKYDYIGDVKKILNTIEYSPENTSEESSGVGSDFKEVMDEYEAFMDEYIEFMQTYNQNPTDAELMSQYMDVMAEYSSYSVKIASLKNDELTDEELAYYIEVTNRVSQKLLNAGLSN